MESITSREGPCLRPVRLSFVALACAVGLAVPLAPTTSYAASAPPDGSRLAPVSQHSLRRALTNQNFYFVMGDRFANGSTANDTGGLGDDPLVSGFDPTAKGFYNGGDLRGLKSKLDYIQGLGTDAIWLTPIFKNKAVQPEDGPPRATTDTGSRTSPRLIPISARTPTSPRW